MSHALFHSSEGNKWLPEQLMIDSSVSVIGLYLRVNTKMSYTDELFIFHSLMADTWRQWPLDLEVEFSNAEWQLRPSLNGNIMVFQVFLSMFCLLTSFLHPVHFNDSQWPVIIWLCLSDTIYTERYMRQPSENYHAYSVSFQRYPLVSAGY